MSEDRPSLGGSAGGSVAMVIKNWGLWDGDGAGAPLAGLGGKVRAWALLLRSPPPLAASRFAQGQALGANEGRNELVTSRLISQETYSVLAKNR